MAAKHCGLAILVPILSSWMDGMSADMSTVGGRQLGGTREYDAEHV